jgi:hypothetical protein
MTVFKQVLWMLSIPVDVPANGRRRRCISVPVQYVLMVKSSPVYAKHWP